MLSLFDNEEFQIQLISVLLKLKVKHFIFKLFLKSSVVALLKLSASVAKRCAEKILQEFAVNNKAQWTDVQFH